MERACINGLSRLLEQNGSTAFQQVSAADRFTRLQGLARRETAASVFMTIATPDQYFYASLPMLPAKTNMIGRAFISEQRMAGQRRVDNKTALVSENTPQRHLGLRALNRPVWRCVQIGGRKMNAAILSVCRRGNSRRIGRPHGGG